MNQREAIEALAKWVATTMPGMERKYSDWAAEWYANSVQANVAAMISNPLWTYSGEAWREQMVNGAVEITHVTIAALVAGGEK